MKRFKQEQKDRVARKLHELLSYYALVILHTSTNIITATDEAKREEEIEILNKIELAAETLYDDLDESQKAFLADLAKNILSVL